MSHIVVASSPDICHRGRMGDVLGKGRAHERTMHQLGSLGENMIQKTIVPAGSCLKCSSWKGNRQGGCCLVCRWWTKIAYLPHKLSIKIDHSHLQGAYITNCGRRIDCTLSEERCREDRFFDISAEQPSKLRCKYLTNTLGSIAK